MWQVPELIGILSLKITVDNASRAMMLTYSFQVNKYRNGRFGCCTSSDQRRINKAGNPYLLPFKAYKLLHIR
jgi:hypothetical protein